MALKPFLLNQGELRSKQKQENSECWVQWFILQMMQELLLGKILLVPEDAMSDIGGSFLKSLFVLGQHDNLDWFI